MSPIPIPTLHLFPVLDQKLTVFLRSLPKQAWNYPTRAKLWTVKDIAAHLLDGNLRHISLLRDKYASETPGELHSYQELLNYLNRLNSDWVTAWKRVSPEILILLLEQTGKTFFECLQTLDLHADAAFPVAWAGHSKSPNWFHIAREYTEKWHHQQQIREACGETTELLDLEFFEPLMNTFLCALPYAYRSLIAPEAVVALRIEGLEKTWTIRYLNTGWEWATTVDSPSTLIEVDKNTAWQLATKGITSEEGQAKARITGQREFAIPYFNMLAVMA